MCVHPGVWILDFVYMRASVRFEVWRFGSWEGFKFGNVQVFGGSENENPWDNQLLPWPTHIDRYRLLWMGTCRSTGQVALT